MTQKDWSFLKSGSDIRGVAAGDGITLTSEIATACAGAFITLLARESGKDASALRVAVGRDCRVSSPALAAAVIKGFSLSGAEVLDCGGATTPSMFFATHYADCDGAVEITASHLPWNRNGLKFFTKEGGLEGAQIAEILQMAPQWQPSGAPGDVKSYDIMTPYSEDIVAMIRRKVGCDTPLAGRKIVVNAGNGMGGFFTEKVLKPLGADTEGSVNLAPDGMFPVHIPNPEHQPAMEATAKAVTDSGAVLGICFDTDCDRAAIVDGDGATINSSRLIALIAAVILEEYPGGIIVTDSVTSSALTPFIAAHGGQHHRFRRGYKNVINEALRLESEGKSAPLAIETSGHAALKENRFLDDGAYLVARLLIRLAQLEKGQTLGSIIAQMPAPAASREIRMKIEVPDFAAYGKTVLEDLPAYFEEVGFSLERPNYEGVRANYTDGEQSGWVLVRMSLHDPVIPINMEGDSEVLCDKIWTLLNQYLGRFEALNKM